MEEKSVLVKTVYQFGQSSCSGVGMEWTREDLESALQYRIPADLFDDAGMSQIEETLADMEGADFSAKNFSSSKKDLEKFSDWRVGESIAGIYLTDHRACEFPWPSRRDHRTSKASLPGADLVGFKVDDDGICFSFGEVKTSSQSKNPPDVMRGAKGLRLQIEHLRDRKSLREALIKYLGFRAIGAIWQESLSRSFSSLYQE